MNYYRPYDLDGQARGRMCQAAADIFNCAEEAARAAFVDYFKRCYHTVTGEEIQGDALTEAKRWCTLWRKGKEE